MEAESIVYGCIKDSLVGAQQSERIRANRHAMLALPHADEWPFLCQEMFSIPDPVVHAGQYQTEVMHFGASYRAVEYEWNQWLEQFESLLKNMYWVSATVHLETELCGTHTFTWESRRNFHTPGSDDIYVTCQWSHEDVLRL